LWETEITYRNPIKLETAYSISWKDWYAQASNIKNHQMIRKNTNIIVIVKGGEIYEKHSIYRNEVHADCS
jgi:hypothetical protein